MFGAYDVVWRPSSFLATIMPRLPLQLMTIIRSRLTQSPARSFHCLAHPPLITAPKIRQRLFSSSATQSISVITPRHRPTDRIWPYLYKDFDTMPHLDAYFKQVDSLQDKFIDRLREAVAIPSISSEDERRPDVHKVPYTPI